MGDVRLDQGGEVNLPGQDLHLLEQYTFARHTWSAIFRDASGRNAIWEIPDKTLYVGSKDI